ncbi:polysaccharide deacetylase family protein [Pelagibacteraceae bacterium]|nr:polysaccharide deacetylase family protein [Pelagibacteraceae bacterium]
MQLFKLKNVLLYVFYFYFIFLNNLLAETINENGANVFMYHRFDESKYPSTNISTDQLEEHLMYLIDNKFNIESIDEILEKKRTKQLFLPKTVGFTVDDAFQSFYNNGWPIFKKYNVPVTLFVSTDVVNQSHWNYMSWDDLRKFVNEGGSIALHSASHMHLPLFDISLVKKDLLSSISIINQELNISPKVFAYPYGEASKEIINLLKDLEIEFAFGQHSGVIHKNTNQYYLPRFALNENYGKIDRFIFSANVKPLIVENFLPNKILLKKNTIPKIQFDLLSRINNSQLNCFSNSGGKWKNVNLKIDPNKRVNLNLTEPFLTGRGRINCTTKVETDWLWFGYQFTIN